MTQEDRIQSMFVREQRLGKIACIAAFVSVSLLCLGLYGLQAYLVTHRTREIGVMRAIGARTPTLMGMFVMEGVLQGAFSWLVAVPLSFIVARPLAAALGQAMFEANLDFQYNFGAVFAWLGIIVVISILASILPARSATVISVRDSLAYA